MKLLLDENLSRRIIPVLQGDFPGSTQVALVNLERADDREIWNFARDNNYVIVTKDDDFAGLLAMLGYPPKVIVVAIGNCTNQQLVNVLIQEKNTIELALLNSEIGIVELKN